VFFFRPQFEQFPSLKFPAAFCCAIGCCCWWYWCWWWRLRWLGRIFLYFTVSTFSLPIVLNYSWQYSIFCIMCIVLSSVNLSLSLIFFLWMFGHLSQKRFCHGSFLQFCRIDNLLPLSIVVTEKVEVVRALCYVIKFESGKHWVEIWLDVISKPCVVGFYFFCLLRLYRSMVGGLLCSSVFSNNGPLLKINFAWSSNFLIIQVVWHFKIFPYLCPVVNFWLIINDVYFTCHLSWVVFPHAGSFKVTQYLLLI
jgi:hypothetical protein